ncbi:glycosyltransferase family 4 protein [Haloferula sp. BvORR071]|uniref:glycosyltransferase family 4 protein n=1 Tax=Haloferula sp. BvORR071 TaxID=1396141 RepID=UPI0005556C0D|nr:glycosyltransferase family 4 protein [Haloferula sp. BvORR071]
MTSASSSTGGFSCALVTGALQPYAIDFYRALDASLRRRGASLIVLVGSRSTYRPWSSLGIQEDDPLFQFVGGKFAPAWIQRILGSSSRDKVFLPGSSKIGSALSERQPDIVIVNERNPICLGAAAWARRHGVPCILSTDIGRNPPRYSSTRMHLVYHRLIGGFFDGVLAKTVEGKTAFARRGAPVLLAPHAIDTARYPLPTCAKEEPFRFLFVGVLEERKGLDVLMAAARIAHAAGHRFSVRLVGSGPWQASAEDAASPWLSLAGFKDGDNLIAEYHQAGAFVLPTREDTYAVVVHEAASCGLPLLVSTGAGASLTLVEDGISGYRFAPADFRRLAEHMSRLLEDSQLCQNLGAGARALAEEWSTDRAGEKLAEWLPQFLRSGRAKTRAGEPRASL